MLGGTNLRKLLVGNGINVYRSITRWTNCSGKQRCGTCIVDVRDANEVYTASESAIVRWWCSSSLLVRLVVKVVVLFLEA